jgi:hypothetical protein
MIATQSSQSNCILKPYRIFSVNTVPINQTNENAISTLSAFCVQLHKTVAKMENLEMAVLTTALPQKSEEFVMSKDGKFVFKCNDEIEVCGVDCAQGIEKDVIILIITRHDDYFLYCPDLLNVAMTRAKKALYICVNFNMCIHSVSTPQYLKQ